MNFKSINLKLVVLLVLFGAFLYLWNLTVKKKNKKFKTGLIYTTTNNVVVEVYLRHFQTPAMELLCESG